MSMIRAPAVSGLFYDANPAVLSADVDLLLSEAELSSDAELPFNPKALIVPHAGYIYSGAVAATAYVTLLPVADQVRSVAILGPSHRVPLEGMAITNSSCFRTPLGEVSVDQVLSREIAALPDVKRVEQAHLYEHSLEVQLPFLQKVIPNLQIVPVVVGQTPEYSVAELVHFLLAKNVLVIVSTDLSHYHPYEEACDIDSATSDNILALRGGLMGEQVCGCYALNGLLLAARELNLQCELLSLANSGDTAGDRLRVVGYGAYALG